MPSGCLDPLVANCASAGHSLNGEDFEDLWTGSLTEVAAPQETALIANYPNPFNPSTTISYTLAASTEVTLKIFNLLGQEVATLAHGFESPGRKSIVWNGVDAHGLQVPSGIYFCRLTAGSIVQVRSMILSK
jgi:hypothetical protein